MPAVRPIQTPTMPSPKASQRTRPSGGADGPVAEQAEEHRGAGVLAAAQQPGGGEAGAGDELHQAEEQEESGGEAGGGEAGGAGVEEAVGERLRGGGERGEQQRARGEAEA